MVRHDQLLHEPNIAAECLSMTDEYAENNLKRPCDPKVADMCSFEADAGRTSSFHSMASLRLHGMDR